MRLCVAAAKEANSLRETVREGAGNNPAKIAWPLYIELCGVATSGVLGTLHMATMELKRQRKPLFL